MTVDVTSVGAPLRERVAEEIRVALARKRMSAAKLARLMGVSQTYVWRRLTGETAFDLDDLERIASALEVGVLDLIPAGGGRRPPVSGITEHSTHPSTRPMREPGPRNTHPAGRPRSGDIRGENIRPARVARPLTGRTV